MSALSNLPAVGTSAGIALQVSCHNTTRPEVRGKFLFVGGQKFLARGVTYGTFRPDAEGNEFHDRARVEQDFALISAQGFNAVRTYTVPPSWLLDTALRHGLRVFVGVPWEHHVAFLDEPDRMRSIEERVRTGVRACAGHPGVLCIAVGNEIPASIARWHGRRSLERFLARLYRAAKAEDPAMLVTYVNYPSTEYLRLPFFDLVSFNVYLETQATLQAYLARLHNLAGQRPLIMAEIGLDSRRHGEEVQARTLDWQVRTTMASGCGGAFVFSWTDEWHRGGHDIADWDFGLTTRPRQPKPALNSVGQAFAETPFPRGQTWPRISVVVCTYNGARTLRECLEGLQGLNYPDYEVIVVNDGSTDESAAIASEFPHRLISTENRGLSSARNTGLAAATGEIVAYLDDDAYPDQDWLTYLAATFLTGPYAGVGGPNIAPPGESAVAECVVNAPGGPVHVLLSDQVAEHVPGCNMAFRRSALESVGGFDAQFRTAGDDVDICWRLQQRGWLIGFSPAATVWHHRRNSVRAYWKQQRGYGKAEALLERKWPEKYNAVGHIKWTGQLYGQGLTRILKRVGRIYHGVWGSAPFQCVHESTPSLLSVLPAVPEWYLILIALGGLCALGLVWSKLLLVLPLFLLACGATLLQASLSAAQATFSSRVRTPLDRCYRRLLTAALHLMQPLARLCGRVRHGLIAGRSRVPRRLSWPVPQRLTRWRETWQPAEEQLSEIASAIRRDGAVVVQGGDYDRWDLEVRGGVLAAARLLMTVEEHGRGQQLLRFRLWPRCTAEAFFALLVLTGLTAGATADGAWLAAGVLGTATLLLGTYSLKESACAFAALRRALRPAAAPGRSQDYSAQEQRGHLGAGFALPQPQPRAREGGLPEAGLDGLAAAPAVTRACEAQ